MIVRTIRPEEYKRARQLFAIAFDEGFPDSLLSPEQVLEKAVRQPQSRQDLFWQSQWAAFADDDRTMLSTFTAIPYRCHFDGHSLELMGIGGVATLPQYRRMGGVRACFEKALPDMYQKGAAFSYLYPFSTAFYRKFGYELGCQKLHYKLKLSVLPRMEVPGTFELLEPRADLEADILTVEKAWQWRYNLMILEEEIEHRWIAKADPFRDRAYTYVYRNAQGTPKAVVTFQTKMDAGDRCLDATQRFAFVDQEGFGALLQLTKRMEADYSHLLFNLPTDVEPGALLPEWSLGGVECHVWQYGMVRVIDAEQVLRCCRTKGDGDLVIELSDGQIEANNGRFHLRFCNGKTTSVAKTEAAANVSMTIQEFSRLICGRYDMEDWMWLPDAHCFCAPEKAARVFYRKPLMIDTNF